MSNLVQLSTVILIVIALLDSVIALLYDALIRLQSLLARWFAVNLILICHSQ